MKSPEGDLRERLRVVCRLLRRALATGARKHIREAAEILRRKGAVSNE